jgi:hypothetical protein
MVRDTFVFSWSLAVNLRVSVIASQTIRKPSSLRASSTIALQQAAFASPFAADFRECAQASQAPAATTALRSNSKKSRMQMAFKICSLARSLTADLRACTTASQAPASTSAWRPCGRHYIGQFCSRRLIYGIFVIACGRSQSLGSSLASAQRLLMPPQPPSNTHKWLQGAPRGNCTEILFSTGRWTSVLRSSAPTPCLRPHAAACSSYHQAQWGNRNTIAEPSTHAGLSEVALLPSSSAFESHIAVFSPRTAASTTAVQPRLAYRDITLFGLNIFRPQHLHTCRAQKKKSVYR